MITTKALFSAEGQDERSLEFLANAIERNNLPGFDYYEFKRAVFTLMEMKLDEPTAQKSAFTTAATVGMTKEKLIETAGYYHEILVKEKDQFDKALESQNASKITARQEEIKRLQDQIERHKLDISRLQDEIGAYLNQIDQATLAVTNEAEKLAKTKSAFHTTHQSVLLQIERDVENMHKNL
jgi:flagellin-like hook-associated protein FlgL